MEDPRQEFAVHLGPGTHLPPGVKVRYVVYRHPLDYPDAYVIRRWFSIDGGPRYYPEDKIFAVEKEEALIRRKIPNRSELRRVPRHPDWDPAILEAWMQP